MYFKDLSKKERKHLKDQGIQSLREFKVTAVKQAAARREYEMEPCWDCRAIAKKLGVAV